MTILDAYGNPFVPASDPPKPVVHEQPDFPVQFTPTRQLLRAYLRKVAIAHINRHFGPEPRRLRRKLALTLAKRKQFIQEVRDVTKAW